MKRIIFLIIAIFCIILPMNVKAIDLAEYNILNLEQALAAENVEKKFTKYSENDKQATIYLFRGQGCAFCLKFLNFLNDIYEEEGNKFKVISFESWQDDKNAALLKEVAEFNGDDKYGVPYIIIGDEVFPGFTEEAYGDAVKKAINKVYSQDLDDRYDIFTAMEEAKNKESSEFGALEVSIIVGIATIIIIGYDSIRFHMLERKITELSHKKNK